jgi:hypothetical protein
LLSAKSTRFLDWDKPRASLDTLLAKTLGGKRQLPRT